MTNLSQHSDSQNSDFALFLHGLAESGWANSPLEQEQRRAPNFTEFRDTTIGLATLAEIEDINREFGTPLGVDAITTGVESESAAIAPLLDPLHFAELYTDLQLSSAQPKTALDWHLPVDETLRRRSHSTVLAGNKFVVQPRSTACDESTPVAATPIAPAEHEEAIWNDPSFDIEPTDAIFKTPHTQQADHLLASDEDYLDHISLVTPHGRQFRWRDAVGISIEPGNIPRTIYNAAYMQLSALRPTIVAHQAGDYTVIREGMQMHPSNFPESGMLKEGTEDERIQTALYTRQIPGALILERGLFAYDALQFVAAEDPTAAETLANTPGLIPDKAYLDFFTAVAVQRPLTFKYDTGNNIDSLMYAGLDSTAIRCLALETDPYKLESARTLLLEQANSSFGPEFLEIVSDIHDYLPQAERAGFLADLVREINEDYSRNDSKTQFPGREPRVVAPDTVGSDDPEESSANYTVPYGGAALYIERMLYKINQAAHNARLDRIGAAVADFAARNSKVEPEPHPIASAEQE